MRIAILGAGAWGSALAISLSASHEVVLWARRREDCEALAQRRESRYLPGCVLPPAVRIEAGLEASLAAADMVVVATATAGLRPVCESIAALGARPRLLWACKGFDAPSGRLPHQVVDEALPAARGVGVLSGPSFALEVARGLPTALVVASDDEAFAAATATALNTRRLRVYSSGDVLGVELGGAVKNVIAIAAGICDGLELGRNARAALITRGLAEVVRLGVAMGGRAETFMGLAGVGDLVLTCTGDLSRNREVGMALARGATLPEALDRLGHVAEGVRSAATVARLAQAHGIEMPISLTVHAVLHEGLGPAAAVQALLEREPKPEAANYRRNRP